MAEILDGSAKFEKVQVARNDRLSMPSSTGIDVDFSSWVAGSWGNHFFPPADGFLRITTKTTSTSLWLGGEALPYGVGEQLDNACVRHYMAPVCKGVAIRVYFSPADSIDAAVFIPAQSTLGGEGN